MKLTKFAIIYDFDKTLATTDMQNYAFIPALGMTPAEFWNATTEYANKEKIEKILSYMYMMVKMCKEQHIPLTKKFLNECGKKVELFPGVQQWFKRINEYGRQRGLRIEHFLCSSGNLEIVQGTPIYKEFKKAFGCEFLYDPITKEAIWPKNTINYTQKTQYLFRISKGAYDLTDDDSVNKKITNRKILYSNMIYIGDGLTDIASMVLLNQQGGSSIAVSKNYTNKTIKTLINDKRVNYIVSPDYNEGSKLDKIVKRLIDRSSVNTELRRFDKKANLD